MFGVNIWYAFGIAWLVCMIIVVLTYITEIGFAIASKLSGKKKAEWK